MMKRGLLASVVVCMLGALWCGAADEMACSDCHDVQLEGSAHHEVLSCRDCHEGLDVEKHTESGAKPVNCAECHSDQGESMEFNIHKRLTKRVGDLQPGCADCHGSHKIEPMAAITDPSQKFCQSCHENVTLTGSFHLKPFIANDDCLSCHDTQDYHAVVESSVHTEFACIDCHGYVGENLDSHVGGIPFDQKANCATCHAQVAATHAESIHGISLAEAIPEAANCWNCHGSHHIVPVKSAESPVNLGNLSNTCGKCHADPEFVKKFSMGIRNVVIQYQESVHGRLALEGREDAPNCATCHESHAIKNRRMPGSTISSFNVPQTCGQCHSEIEKEYKESIHWVLAKRGISEAPVCNDCHSEHDVHRVNSPDRRQAIRQLQNDSCIRCHQDPMLARRFQLNEQRPSEYLDSYHGLAVMRGDPDAALCIDCHGVHSILPKSHSASLIHPDNVRETCATCHPGATKTFALSYAHNEVVTSSRTAEYWVRQIYIWMIIIVISGMIVHNVIILGFELHKHRDRSRKQVALRRFNGNEVIQHLLLMLFFTLLALTGFALKYPDFPLFRLLTAIGLNEPTRQWLHRAMGVGLVVLGVYHIVYLFAARSGRHLLKEMLPRPRDMRDMVHNILYHVRLRKTRPSFQQFNYVEKSEYWALVWGTIIMAATGFLLWFPTMVGDWAPIWLIRVSEIIHLYEAILATLAILVWHLFFVIYHPNEYPMNLAWIDGSISLETFKHHYREQYLHIVEEWRQHREESRPEEKLSYDTRLLLKTLRKHDLDPDLLLKHEEEADTEDDASQS